MGRLHLNTLRWELGLIHTPTPRIRETIPWDDRFREAMEGLSRLEQQVFIRRYWYLDSTVQIADALGISRRKTTSILRRLRQRLCQ